MKQISRLAAVGALSILSLALAGCLGGGNDGSSGASSVMVTPSLGVVTNATVNVYQADGTTLLGAGELGSAGQVTIDIQGYSGPVVIEVAGDSDAQYYDEATGALVSLPAGKKIRAMASSASGTFAVTALTELAYQGAVGQNLLPLDASEVDAMNEKVRAALAAEVGSLLTPPTAFNVGTTVGSLGNDDAGKYALKLAALAQLGSGQAAPALAVMEALIADLADGVIDGNGSGGASVNAPYASFASELTTAIGTIAASFGTTALQTATSGFAAPTTSIDFTYGSGGTTSGGSTSGGSTSGGGALSCNTSLFSVPLSLPTSMQWAGFAKSYTVDEGSYDNITFNFVKSGSGTLVVGSSLGSVSYNGISYTPTSVCIEDNATYGLMLYLHFAQGHIDVFANGDISGVSPVNGSTILKGPAGGG